MAFVDKNSSAGWRVKSRRIGIFGGALLAVALMLLSTMTVSVIDNTSNVGANALVGSNISTTVSTPSTAVNPSAVMAYLTSHNDLKPIPPAFTSLNVSKTLASGSAVKASAGAFDTRFLSLYAAIPAVIWDKAYSAALQLESGVPIKTVNYNLFNGGGFQPNDWFGNTVGFISGMFVVGALICAAATLGLCGLAIIGVIIVIAVYLYFDAQTGSIVKSALSSNVVQNVSVGYFYMLNQAFDEEQVTVENLLQLVNLTVNAMMYQAAAAVYSQLPNTYYNAAEDLNDSLLAREGAQLLSTVGSWDASNIQPNFNLWTTFFGALGQNIPSCGIQTNFNIQVPAPANGASGLDGGGACTFGSSSTVTADTVATTAYDLEGTVTYGEVWNIPNCNSGWSYLWLPGPASFNGFTNNSSGGDPFEVSSAGNFNLNYYPVGSASPGGPFSQHIPVGATSSMQFLSVAPTGVYGLCSSVNGTKIAFTTAFPVSGMTEHAQEISSNLTTVQTNVLASGVNLSYTIQPIYLDAGLAGFTGVNGPDANTECGQRTNACATHTVMTLTNFTLVVGGPDGKTLQTTTSGNLTGQNATSGCGNDQSFAFLCRPQASALNSFEPYLWADFNVAEVQASAYWYFLKGLGFNNATEIPLACFLPTPSQLLPPTVTIADLQGMSPQQALALYISLLESEAAIFPNALNFTLGLTICGQHYTGYTDPPPPCGPLSTLLGEPSCGGNGNTTCFNNCGSGGSGQNCTDTPLGPQTATGYPYDPYTTQAIDCATNPGFGTYATAYIYVPQGECLPQQQPYCNQEVYGNTRADAQTWLYSGAVFIAASFFAVGPIPLNETYNMPPTTNPVRFFIEPFYKNLTVNQTAPSYCPTHLNAPVGCNLTGQYIGTGFGVGLSTNNAGSAFGTQQTGSSGLSVFLTGCETTSGTDIFNLAYHSVGSCTWKVQNVNLTTYECLPPTYVYGWVQAPSDCTLAKSKTCVELNDCTCQYLNNCAPTDFCHTFPVVSTFTNLFAGWGGAVAGIPFIGGGLDTFITDVGCVIGVVVLGGIVVIVAFVAFKIGGAIRGRKRQ